MPHATHSPANRPVLVYCIRCTCRICGPHMHATRTQHTSIVAALELAARGCTTKPADGLIHQSDDGHSSQVPTMRRAASSPAPSRAAPQQASVRVPLKLRCSSRCRRKRHLQDDGICWYPCCAARFGGNLRRMKSTHEDGTISVSM
eukprot:365608-Chlamydomonas_euryale.AAC.30